MEKILATTDLSVNSASAIRFAHKLCLLRGATMVVGYVDESPVPTGWSVAEVNIYHQKRQVINKKKVQFFLNRIFRSLKKPIPPVEIEIRYDTDLVKAIWLCGEEHHCRYICISNNGGGKLKRLIGTHTSKLIARSAIPVICVPSAYRVTKIDRICYASDMTHYLKEINQVLEFAQPLGAKLEVLHMASPSKTLPTKVELTRRLKEITGEDISFHIVERNILYNLHKDIDISIKKIKPSMAVFFTKKATSFIDNLFHPSPAQLQSLIAKIPLLSFRK